MVSTPSDRENRRGESGTRRYGHSALRCCMSARSRQTLGCRSSPPARRKAQQYHLRTVELEWGWQAMSGLEFIAEGRSGELRHWHRCAPRPVGRTMQSSEAAHRLWYWSLGIYRNKCRRLAVVAQAAALGGASRQGLLAHPILGDHVEKDVKAIRSGA